MNEKEVRQWCLDNGFQMTSYAFWEAAADAIRIVSKWARQHKEKE